MDETTKTIVVLIALLVAIIAGYYFVKWTMEYFNKKREEQTEHFKHLG